MHNYDTDFIVHHKLLPIIKLVYMYNMYLNTKGRLLKWVLNFSQCLSIVSHTFEQNINLYVGYDLVFVLITGPKLNLELHVPCLHFVLTSW